MGRIGRTWVEEQMIANASCRSGNNGLGEGGGVISGQLSVCSKVRLIFFLAWVGVEERN